MTAEPLTCPLCNAVVPPSPGLAVGRKAACPRCGEAFTVTRLPADDRITAAPPAGSPRDDRITAAPPAGANPAPYRKPVRANLLVGAAVVGVMLLTAGIGLVYALATVQTRRDHDRALPRKQRKPWLLGDRPAEEEPQVAPGQLAGLGYLPETTGVVVGLHVEGLLASPAGKAWAAQGFAVAGTTASLAALEGWTGLAAQDLEHVVVGIDVRDPDVSDLTPPVHVVVRTRRSDGANRIRVALKATAGREVRGPEGVRRTLYTARVADRLSVRLWVADDRTVVIGLFSNLERVPTRPAPGVAHLSADLRQAIETRLPAGVPLWAAGHSENWKNTWLPAVLGQARDLPLAGRLDQARTFALGLVPADPARLAGAFRFADEAAAVKIVKQDLEPRRQAHPETFKFSQAGPWIDVQQSLPGQRE